MKPRSAARLAWSLWGLMVLGLATGGAWNFLNRQVPREEPVVVGLFIGFAALALATVGALVASRRRENPIGWILLGVAVAFGVGGGFADGYAAYTLLNEPGALPAGPFAAWLAHFVIEGGGLLFGSFVFVLLLFPDGRLPSRRWRAVAWLAAVGAVLFQLVTAFEPGDLPGFPGVENPLGVGFVGPVVRAAELPLFLVFLGTLLAAAASLVVRFRSSRGAARQQLKWFAGAGVWLALTWVTGPFWWIAVPSVGEIVWPILFALALAAIPGAVGIAILRYRLWDIDRIINRTLVYAGLTAVLGGLYGVVVVGLGTIVGSSSLVVAASTLLVAALFRPARRWVQGFIDRRFYRRRYDAQRTLEAFAARLRQQVDIDQLNEDLLEVVRETVQPVRASLWLAQPRNP
jgi:hypothetical protein